MIRKLDRLVGGTFTRLFLAFVIGAPLLFVLGDLIENLDRHLERGVGWANVALGYLFMVPTFVFWSFPIAGLIATVFTIHGMTVHREIMAAKAGGISFYRIALPVVLLGAALSGLAFAVSDMVPQGYRRAGEIFDPRRANAGVRATFVHMTEEGHSLAAAQLLMTAKSLMRPRFEIPPSDSTPGVVVAAERAVWDSLSGWTFENASWRRVEPDGRVEWRRYDSLPIPEIEATPDELLQSPATEEEEMTREELVRLARAIESSGGDGKAYRVEKEIRYSLAAATFVIVLFGAPLATSSKRGGAAFGVGLSLGSTILYMLLLRLSEAMGTAGLLEPFWAAWIPNLLFLAAGTIFFVRVRT